MQYVDWVQYAPTETRNAKHCYKNMDIVFPKMPYYFSTIHMFFFYSSIFIVNLYKVIEW